MRIYEIFRRTRETYICSQINIDGSSFNNLNFNIMFFKHMLQQFILNGNFNINLLAIGDIYIDNHHLIEDIGICLGKIFSLSVLNKNLLNRYGYSYVLLDDSLSRVTVDISGRSYLKYEVFYYNTFYFFDYSLFYDFFISFSFNFMINLHITNLYGWNDHHKIESIFKSLGISLKKSLTFKKYLNYSSTKGYLF